MVIKMDNLGDKLISVYWFVILVLVAGGLVAMVYVFYGAQYDVRGVEGTIMNNQIADCISWKGVFNDAIFDKSYQENFLNNCHLNFGVEEDSWKDLQYYFDVAVFDADNLGAPKTEFSEGNKNLISSCEIANENYDKLAKCVTGKFYAVDKDKNQYLIKILSIVRKTEKNVKQ
jgi:hypothetical protein